jgi:hypothetical protein
MIAMKNVISLLTLILISFSTPTLAMTYTQQVNARDNLYNTDWLGNPFSDIWDDGSWNPYPKALNTPGAWDARAVEDSAGNIVDFSKGLLSLTSTGKVVDAGTTQTDANGQGWLFRDLSVYSLIGLWSSTTNSITAMGNAFFIGTSANFSAPLETAYLFLANNDGIFDDNSGYYDVTIKVENMAVPLPASIWLIISGVMVFLGFSRQQRNKA